jgi:polar amino acid transport system substrate-binding protein
MRGPAKFFLLLLLAGATHASQDAWDQIQKTGVLRWGADQTGGAPYVLPDPQNPKKIIGFEVDVMEAVGRRLSVKTELVQIQWDQLVPALLRGDCDIAFNGLEVTDERARVVDFSDPYYVFSEQITVRRGDRRFQSLEDMKGHKVGTLSASLALTMLADTGGITVVPYPSPVEAYQDLAIGRTDAALFDVPIAAWYAGPHPKLENLPQPIGEGLYAAALRKDSPVLRERLNAAIAGLMRSGELEGIYRKWNIWTPAQEKLSRPGAFDDKVRRSRSIDRYLPILFRAAGITLILSVLSMALAVVLGLGLCLGKLYGPRTVQIVCQTFIEVIRGTPLLIQLYLLYYGLPNLGIQLNAFVAAVLGLGMNYAAYEAEIYRAGILAIPRGQDEAARSLGMTRAQSLRYVVLPQSVRVILPPSTNDFIALFKDTSLVSVITVTELTRAYSVAATATYRFMELGLLTALLYFAMSFPLSLWARRLERKRHVALH